MKEKVLEMLDSPCDFKSLKQCLKIPDTELAYILATLRQEGKIHNAYTMRGHHAVMMYWKPKP